jgi:hypothetical protein
MIPNERLVENNTAKIHVPRIKLESYPLLQIRVPSFALPRKIVASLALVCS